MKRSFVIAIAVSLWLTGCSTSPSSNRYIEAEEQTIEPTQTASEQPAQTENSQSEAQDSPTQTEPMQAEPTQQVEEQTPEKTSDPAKKPAKADQKVQESKKKNESVANAVTDSIMDNGSDQAVATGQEAERLKKSIEQIRSLVKDLKQHAEDNDAAKMKDISSQIAQDWEAMKSDVDASFPDMVDFLEEKIVKLNELQAGDTINPDAMLQLDYELYQAFRQLADKAGV
ncbi:hypothetical protein [Cohnella sp.]|uniref:hypothetical protein n=1 Tax=Cohnella sp. TaxID=1883426 RepID=UPI00356521FD